MTIILQHEFWDLAVDADGFEVSLSFSRKPERLTIPFECDHRLQRSVRPVRLQARAAGRRAGGGPRRPRQKSERSAGRGEAGPGPPAKPSQPAATAKAAQRAEKPAEPAGEAKVVSIDAFRKK